MSAYTKGPWEAASRKGDYWDSVVYLPQRMGHEVCQCFYERGNEAECEANAQLIAAAPDLLEALKEIYYALVSEPIVDGEDSEDCWLLKPSSAVGVMQNALAAINKAEGRS